MKFLKTALLIFSLAVVIFLPQRAIAQQNSGQKAQCDELRQQFQNAGGGEIIGTLPEFCSTGQVYNTFLNAALYAVGIVAVIMVIYGGYLYMTSGANEGQKKKGRDILVWSIIGLAVVLTAAVIVNVVIRAIVENRFV